MTIVGRAQIDHPALGTAGGSALHAAIETIYTNISNDLAGRFETASAVANSNTTTFTHNFGVAFNELTVLLYTGTHPNLTRVLDPTASGYTIVENGTNPKTQINVTAPSFGGPHTYAVQILHAGSRGSGLAELTPITSSQVAIAGQRYLADTSSSGFTLTLPAAPSIGAEVFVFDSKNTWGVNTLTIARNGSQIEGSGTDLFCNVSGSRVQLIYVSGSRGWAIFN